LTSPYRVLGIFVMPEESVAFGVPRRSGRETYRVEAAEGAVRKVKAGAWEWRAPGEPGLHPVRIVRESDGCEILLNAFVMVPLSEVRDGKLNGYRIGEYPAKPLKGLAIYKPPPGLVEVTEANRATPVSPHFTLEQFLCKQEGGYPKYLVLKTRLLLKLEYLLQVVNRNGLRCDTFHVMSGYRTPYYNAAIGNVKYSRHVWGGAADIFIDENPRDGMMDDLNGDGRNDVHDAAVLYHLFDERFGKEEYEPFVGGLGQYRKTAFHGPFVHVDVRGFRARWGT
jgi:hypothetical protein